tara:strand:+ start:224 stop:889 length:666 start_codon:yes stop_codon:yes gene_type:complete
MAQNFRRYALGRVGTTAQAITASDSYDTVISIRLANVTSNMVLASAFVTSDGSTGENIGSDFAYTVTAAGGAFLLDSQNKPAITIYKGFTYTFDVSNASNSGHVLAFATAADAAGSSQYTTGVTSSGTAGQAGATVTLVTTSSTPTTLYYYCTAHTGMGNSITVGDVHYLVKDAPVPSGSSLELIDGGSKIIQAANDHLFIQSDTASSIDAWVSVVDDIST